MALSSNNPGYIVVEGPIGSGKAGLAGRLAESFDGELILDNPRENPFLSRFYQNHRQAALPSQLFLLFQRARVLDHIRQSDLFCNVRVTDFLMDKDRLFAEHVLDRSELALYQQVYQTLDMNPPRPNLVIYLQAPPDVLLRRIASRGLETEKGIDLRYLERLCEAYANFFYRYDEAPLLIVNAAEFDPAQRDSDYSELLQEIVRVRPGRQFFNPAATSMV